MAVNTAKITFSAPYEFKAKLDSLKSKLGLSVSAMIIKAVKEFEEKQELERWIKGAKLAESNKEYIKDSKSLGNTGVEVYDY